MDRTFAVRHTPTDYTLRRGRGRYGKRLGWAHFMSHDPDESEWRVMLDGDQFTVRGTVLDVERECDRRRGVDS